MERLWAAFIVVSICTSCVLPLEYCPEYCPDSPSYTPTSPSYSPAASPVRAEEEDIYDDEVCCMVNRVLNKRAAASYSDDTDVGPPVKRTRWSSMANEDTQKLSAVVTWKSIFDIVSEWPRDVPADYHSAAARRIIVPHTLREEFLFHVAPLWSLICDYAGEVDEPSKCGTGVSECIPCHYNCDIRVTLQCVLSGLTSASPTVPSVAINGHSWNSWEFAELIASYLRIDCYNAFCLAANEGRQTSTDVIKIVCLGDFNQPFHMFSHHGFSHVPYGTGKYFGFDPRQQLLSDHAQPGDTEENNMWGRRCRSTNRPGETIRNLPSSVGLWVSCSRDNLSFDAAYEEVMFENLYTSFESVFGSSPREPLHRVTFKSTNHLQDKLPLFKTERAVLSDVNGGSLILGPDPPKPFLFAGHESKGVIRDVGYSALAIIENQALSHDSPSFCQTLQTGMNQMVDECDTMQDGLGGRRYTRYSMIEKIQDGSRSTRTRKSRIDAVSQLNALPRHRITFDPPRVFLLMNGATFTLLRVRMTRASNATKVDATVLSQTKAVAMCDD